MYTFQNFEEGLLDTNIFLLLNINKETFPRKSDKKYNISIKMQISMIIVEARLAEL